MSTLIALAYSAVMLSAAVIVGRHLRAVAESYFIESDDDV